MTIGELIRQYCYEHGMSNLRFAQKCGLSKGYISMLVNGKNPKTGKPLKPTLETYGQIAKAMGITVDELFQSIEDVPVTLSVPARSDPDDDDTWTLRQEERDDPDRKALFMLSKYGSAKDIRQVNALIDALRATNPDFYDGDDPA